LQLALKLRLNAGLAGKLLSLSNDNNSSIGDSRCVLFFTKYCD
jgi:hypothetical protein